MRSAFMPRSTNPRRSTGTLPVTSMIAVLAGERQLQNQADLVVAPSHQIAQLLKGKVARDVRGRALPSGHFLAEEVPDETLSELLAFFGSA